MKILHSLRSFLPASPAKLFWQLSMLVWLTLSNLDAYAQGYAIESVEAVREGQQFMLKILLGSWGFHVQSHTPCIRILLLA